MSDRKLGRGFNDISNLNNDPSDSGIFDLSDEIAYSENDVLQVEIDRLEPNPHQPRLVIKEDALASLVESIRENGILQPVLIRPTGDRFQLIAGERRWQAAKRLGLATIPAVVRNVDDSKALELAIIENVQREDLNPMERALAYHDLIERFQLTQEDAAKRLSVNRTTVTNLLRLLELPKEIQNSVASGDLSMGHARALLAVPTEERMKSLAKKIVAEDLSVRETERQSSTQKQESLLGTVAPRRRQEKPSHIKGFEDNLKRALSTKVVISEGAKVGTGTLKIDFYSLEQFETIYYRLMTPVKDHIG